MPRSSSYTSSSSSGNPTAIHKSGCRSVLFTVFANTRKLRNPTFELTMGDKVVSTEPDATPGGSRVFGSVTIPYGGERKVYLKAISRSGKLLGKHTFDLSKIPNMYSYYEGTVELSKKKVILGSLNLRIDFSKKRVSKIVDRKGIFSMCSGPGTANFERDVKRKGNLCNAVVSDGSSEDAGRRKIFLNKSSGSTSSNSNRRRRVGAVRAVKASDSSSTHTNKEAVRSPANYGTALAPSLSGERRSSPKSPAKTSSSSSSSSSSTRSDAQKHVTEALSRSSSKSGPKDVFVEGMEIRKSSSSSVSSSEKIPTMRSYGSGLKKSSSSGSDKNVPGVPPTKRASRSSSSSSSKSGASTGRRRRTQKVASPDSQRAASTSVSPKSKFSCGKMCGGSKKKEPEGTVPKPQDPSSSPRSPAVNKDGKSMRRRRTGRKVPKKEGGSSSPVTPATKTSSFGLRRASSSCSSVRSNKSNRSRASSCIGRKDKSSSPVAKPVVVATPVVAEVAPQARRSSSSSSPRRLARASSSSSHREVVAVAAASHSRSSSSSSSSSTSEAPLERVNSPSAIEPPTASPVQITPPPSSSSVASTRRRRRRTNQNRDAQSTVSGKSKKSIFSCNSSKASKFSCGGSKRRARKEKKERSQSMVSDLSSVSGF